MILIDQLRSELRKATLLEKSVSLIGLFSLILSVYSTFAPSTLNITIIIRDIFLIIFFFLVSLVSYERFWQKRNQLSFAQNYLNEISEHNHNVSHVLRDTVCKLIKIINKNNQKLYDFASNIIERHRLDEDIGDAIFALCYSEVSIDDFLESFPDMKHISKDIEKGIKEIKENLQKDVIRLAKMFLLQITNELKQQLESRLKADNIREKITISIKQFGEKTSYKRGELGSEALNDLTVRTIFRDNETYMKKERDILDQEWSVGLNTAFKHCYEGTNRQNWCFVRNRLKKLHEEGFYKNQRSEFWKLYDATIVVPIQDDRGRQANIYGFLTADCQNKSSEEILNFDAHFAIMASVADTIATLWKMIDTNLPYFFNN